jgi:membrane protease YdiL (CAAX protease family)
VLKIYLITIGLFYLSFTLMITRYYANKGKFKLGDKDEKKWFIWIRFITLGFIPIVNILMSVIWIYYSILASSEKFIKVMSD